MNSNQLMRKKFAIGIILLFLGTCIIPSSGDILLSDGMSQGGIRDSPPDEEWNRTYSHPSGYTGGNCIQLTPDGGYIVTGYAGAENHYSFYLLKVDEVGVEQWNRTFGSGYIEANWVEVTSDTGYIITGRTCQWTGEEYVEDVWLIKTDVNGNEEWNKTFGGIGDQWGNCVKQTGDGGYIVTGADLVDDTQFLLLIKTDASGNEIWTETYGNNSRGYSLVLTTDGGFIITGTSDLAVLLMKTDENGTVEWEKKFFYDVFLYSCGTCVQKTFDGGYIIGGNTGPGSLSDFLLLKTDEDGVEQWNRTFFHSGTDWGRTVIQTMDGDYVLGGIQVGQKGVVPDGFWLIRTDPNGSVVWEKIYLPSLSARCQCVQQTLDDGFIATGVINAYSAGSCVILKLNAGNNQPPSSSPVEGTGWGVINESYSFCINASDPEGDTLYCTWDWGDGTVTEWLGPYPTDLTICTDHSWSQNGAYEIRVKLKDRFGHESDWSDPVVIHVGELKQAVVFGRYSNLSQEGEQILLEAYNIRLLSVIPFQYVHYTNGEMILLDENSPGLFRIFPFLLFLIGVGGVVTYP